MNEQDRAKLMQLAADINECHRILNELELSQSAPSEVHLIHYHIRQAAQYFGLIEEKNT